jgi:hypothetical protein
MSWDFKPLWLLLSEGLERTSQDRMLVYQTFLGQNSILCNVLFWEWPKLCQQQKHTQTTPRIKKDEK